MNVLLIGYEEALTHHVSAVLKTNQLLCDRLSIDQAIDPNFLRDKADWADKIVLVTTDTFMGLNVDLSNALEATTDVVDELLLQGKPIIHINSTLALGRGNKNIPLSAESDWTDNLDWNEEAYMLHRIDREFWRGIAEGMQGCSLMVPIVYLDITKNNAATIRAQEFVSAEIFPTGSTGFLSQTNLTEQLLTLVNTDGDNQTRYLSVDKHLSYKSWIADTVSEAPSVASMESIPKPKYGIWAWIDKLIGRSTGFEQGYVHLLSSELSYSQGKMKA